jgi:hypothetical protein
MQHITKQAFELAHRLAQFYGHEWARRPLEIPDWAKDPRDLQAHIRVETLKARGDNLPGIAEPDLKYDLSVASWEIWHTVGEERTEYSILWHERGYEPLSLALFLTWPDGRAHIHYTHLTLPTHTSRGRTIDADGSYGGALEARHWRAVIEPITWLDGNTNHLEIAFPNRPWEQFLQPSKDPERWWEYVEKQGAT